MDLKLVLGTVVAGLIGALWLRARGQKIDSLENQLIQAKTETDLAVAKKELEHVAKEGTASRKNYNDLVDADAALAAKLGIGRAADRPDAGRNETDN